MCRDAESDFRLIVPHTLIVPDFTGVWTHGFGFFLGASHDPSIGGRDGDRRCARAWCNKGRRRGR